jgi:hypothetical protein
MDQSTSQASTPTEPDSDALPWQQPGRTHVTCARLPRLCLASVAAAAASSIGRTAWGSRLSLTLHLHSRDESGDYKISVICSLTLKFNLC